MRHRLTNFHRFLLISLAILILISIFVGRGSLARLVGSSRRGIAQRDNDATPVVLDPWTELLIDDKACRSPSRDFVSKNDAGRDVNVLHQVLSRGYAGYDPIRTRGFDWDAWFGGLRDDVDRQQDPMPILSFRSVLIRAIDQVPDMHLNIGRWTADQQGVHWDQQERKSRSGYAAKLELLGTPTSWRVALTDEPDWVDAVWLGCTAAGVPLAPQLITDPAAGARPRLVPVLTSQSSPGAAECHVRVRNKTERRSIPLRRIEKSPFANNPDEPPFGLTKTHDIPVVTLRRLPMREWSDFLATADALNHERVIILDVRGNGGGGDAPVYSWFRKLSSQKFVGHHVQDLESEVSLQGTVNSLCGSSREDQTARSASDQAWLNLERHRAQANGQPSRHVQNTAGQYMSGSGGFTGRLIVLTDNRCASACETVLHLAKQMPGTLVLGENSGGFVAFGNLGAFRLPQSGLVLHAGRTWFRPMEGAPAIEEGQGYLPDIWIDDHDWLAVTLQIAECLSERSCARNLDADVQRLRGSVPQ